MCALVTEFSLKFVAVIKDCSVFLLSFHFGPLLKLIEDQFCPILYINFSIVMVSAFVLGTFHNMHFSYLSDFSVIVKSPITPSDLIFFQFFYF